VPKQHIPLMHFVSAPQGAPVPQPVGTGTHMNCALHIEPDGQGSWPPHFCAVHIPPTHVEPAGQLAHAPAGTQAPFSHVEPDGQAAPCAQSSATQVLSTHIEPGGQGWLSAQPPVTGWQLAPTQRVLAGHVPQVAGEQKPVASQVLPVGQSALLAHGTSGLVRPHDAGARSVAKRREARRAERTVVPIPDLNFYSTRAS
jgi:hypothetical protein